RAVLRTRPRDPGCPQRARRGRASRPADPDRGAADRRRGTGAGACRAHLYAAGQAARRRARREAAVNATVLPAAPRPLRLVILGSYVPDGIAVAKLVQQIAGGVTAFYDIDTPVTLASLEDGSCNYLQPQLIPGFDLYLSFTGGPVLRMIERQYGARAARAL